MCGPAHSYQLEFPGTWIYLVGSITSVKVFSVIDVWLPVSDSNFRVLFFFSKRNMCILVCASTAELKMYHHRCISVLV